MHVLILGITETGKTTLAIKLSQLYKANNIGVMVLDPDKRSAWGADFTTDDPDEFLEYAKVNTRCALFIDESGQMIGRYSGAMSWIATNSRKWGHKAHFIAQRAKQIDPLVRTQCTSIFLFKQSLDDAKELARDFVCEELKQSCRLMKGEYIGKRGVDGKPYRSRAW